MVDIQEHLDNKNKKELKKLLTDNEDLFKGTKGHWPGEKIDLQLIPNFKPYSGRYYCIPVSMECVMNQELNRMERIGLITQIKESQWAAPTFGVAKRMEVLE